MNLSFLSFFKPKQKTFGTQTSKPRKTKHLIFASFVLSIILGFTISQLPNDSYAFQYQLDSLPRPIEKDFNFLSTLLNRIKSSNFNFTNKDDLFKQINDFETSHPELGSIVSIINEELNRYNTNPSDYSTIERFEKDFENDPQYQTLLTVITILKLYEENSDIENIQGTITLQYNNESKDYTFRELLQKLGRDDYQTNFQRYLKGEYNVKGASIQGGVSSNLATLQEKNRNLKQQLNKLTELKAKVDGIDISQSENTDVDG